MEALPRNSKARVTRREQRKAAARAVVAGAPAAADGESGPAPLDALDKEVYARVEAEIMQLWEREMGSAPGESSPSDLAKHIAWWGLRHPGGKVDFDNQDALARHVLCYRANHRLMQRVEGLSKQSREELVRVLAEITGRSQ